MKKTDTMEQVSEKLKGLLDLYPIDFSEPKESTVAMRESLARMYADEPMRLFLENAIKYANRGLIGAVTVEQMIFYKARIETMLQLLNMGKQHFVHFEMKRAKDKSLREVEAAMQEVKL